MTPKLRRLASFVVLAGGGVLLLVLLSDEADAPKGPILGKSQPADARSGTLGVVDEKTGTQTQVELREFEFERTRVVEVAPGRLEERSDLRVALKNGRPTPAGDLEMDEPVITFLDVRDRSERGHLNADTGVFFGIGSAVGPQQVDVDKSGPDAFALRGHVHGELPLGSGESVRLDTDELRVEGQTADAPGLVTLAWGALVITGHHLHSDTTTGLFTLESDVVIELPAAGGAPEVTLLASSLTWHVPLEGGGRGWGELLGPVTGTSTSGGSLAASRMELLADASAVTLVGAAEVRLAEDGASRALQAERIVLALGGESGLSLSEAEGGVTVLLEDADGNLSSLRTAEIRSLGDELVAAGQVVLEHPGFRVTGRAWRWDDRTRHLVVGSEFVLQAAADAASPAAGLVVQASALEADLPREGGLATTLAHLAGPVTARLPDGSTMACSEVTFDGPTSRATLAGRVVVDVPRRAAQRHIESDTLVLGLDQGLVGSLSARGAVRVELRDAGDPPTWLDTERVDLTSGLVLAPGRVRIEREGLVIVGDDMRADETERRLDLARDAVLELHDDDGRVDTLRSPDGLTWWLPPGSRDADASRDDAQAGAGHGVLHGPVTGVGTDGSTLAADRVEVDAERSSIHLLGNARLQRPEGGSLSGDELLARRVDGHLVASSPGFVRYDEPGLSAEGTGLDVDDVAGRLGLARDVLVVRRAPDGALLDELRGGGPLEWFPAQDDEHPAHGSLAGGVSGRNALGDAISGSRIAIDDARGRVELSGPARIEGAGGERLEAAGRVLLLRGVDGEAQRLEATTAVLLSRATPAGSWTARADGLVLDRAAHTAVLAGKVRLEHRVGDDLTVLVTGPEGRLQAVTDATGALLFADAVGRVVVTAGNLVAEADGVSFDVRDDHLVLDGDCRFAGITGGMSAPRVEIWPRAERWKVPHAVVELPGTPADG
ncbi:MAG: hypothetical protein H6825_08680 [Planctomycetes bacterium]|nr:hypothetical protein [Planctomycetota bacterium]